MKPITLDDQYTYPMHMTGQATTLPVEQEDDVINRLHEVVKEITGIEVVKAEKPRIGFLP